jgi:hypothetical protein
VCHFIRRYPPPSELLATPGPVILFTCLDVYSSAIRNELAVEHANPEEDEGRCHNPRATLGTYICCCTRGQTRFRAAGCLTAFLIGQGKVGRWGTLDTIPRRRTGFDAPTTQTLPTLILVKNLTYSRIASCSIFLNENPTPVTTLGCGLRLIPFLVVRVQHVARRQGPQTGRVRLEQ